MIKLPASLFINTCSYVLSDNVHKSVKLYKTKPDSGLKIFHRYVKWFLLTRLELENKIVFMIQFRSQIICFINFSSTLLFIHLIIFYVVLFQKDKPKRSVKSESLTFLVDILKIKIHIADHRGRTSRDVKRFVTERDLRC